MKYPLLRNIHNFSQSGHGSPTDYSIHRNSKMPKISITLHPVMSEPENQRPSRHAAKHSQPSYALIVPRVRYGEVSFTLTLDSVGKVTVAPGPAIPPIPSRPAPLPRCLHGRVLDHNLDDFRVRHRPPAVVAPWRTCGLPRPPTPRLSPRPPSPGAPSCLQPFPPEPTFDLSPFDRSPLG